MIKDIVVYLDHAVERQSAMVTAISIAKMHDAHVTGVFVAHDLTLPSYAGVPIPATVYQAHWDELQVQSKAVGVAFSQTLASEQVRGEFQSFTGEPEETLADLARYTDLVVVGQSRGERLFAEGADWVGRAIMHSCAPVVVTPDVVSRQIGQRILVAWDESREATRAVHDSLPLLIAAKQVIVATVNSPTEEQNTAPADLCLHLSRHGVRAEAATLDDPAQNVAEQLLQCASDRQIDLLITGCYGRSRLREFIFGGVTRHLLNRAPIAVLMAH